MPAQETVTVAAVAVVVVVDFVTNFSLTIPLRLLFDDFQEFSTMEVTIWRPCPFVRFVEKN